MINIKRLTESFLNMVQIDSPSGKEGNMAKYLVKELEELGLEVTIDDAGDKVGVETGNVIGKLRATAEGTPIIFSSHMDTVMPGIGIRPIIKDGTIYSDGNTILGSDDKAGIAAILEGIKVIQENNLPHPGIEVVFSIWEEGGLFGAKNLDISLLDGKYCIVLDSSGAPGKIITSAPAQNKLDVKITGKPAHAGVAPEEGISAIMIAARAINNMKLLRIDEVTTANIGIIQGGRATNIVANEVIIKAEVRSLDMDKLNTQTKHMIDAFNVAAAELGGKAEVNLIEMYPSFSIKEDHELINTIKKSFNDIGIKAYTSSSGGGSDANILNNRGIEATNLSIGYRKPHTLEENIRINDLVNISNLFVQLTQNFLNQ